MKDTYRMTMLLDFFGELLTIKQREYLELYYNEDMSLTEIAERAGISKQGVHDIIMRASAALTEYEEKTGLVRRWSEARAGAVNAAEKGIQLPPVVLEYFEIE